MHTSRILADLRHKRKCIDEAIRALERLEPTPPRWPRTPRVRHAGAALEFPVIQTDAVARREVKSARPAVVIKRASIVIVDSHSIVRDSLSTFCASTRKLKVLGQCGDGLPAIELVQTLNPGFVLLDLSLPRLNGLELIRALRHIGHSCKLVVLTLCRDERMVTEALRSGANGYVLKDGPPHHLLEAIKAIQAGDTYISPALRRETPQPYLT